MYTCQMKNKRSTIFTVRDAEAAVIVFFYISIGVLIVVFIYAYKIEKIGLINSCFFVINNIAKIMSASTLILLLSEGGYMLFARVIKERYKEEGKIEAKSEIKRLKAENKNLKKQLTNSKKLKSKRKTKM